MTIIYGLLISLAITAICAFALVKFCKGEFSIVAAIIGLLLLAFLTFENTRLIKDCIQYRNVDKIIDFVEASLIATNTVLPEDIQNYTFGPLEAQGIVLAVKGFDIVNQSSYAKYVDASDFTGKSWVSISTIIRNLVRKESLKSICFRIVLCILAIGLAEGLVLLLGMKRGSRGRNAYYGESSTGYRSSSTSCAEF